MSFAFKGKTALVTGASSGIGQALARALAAQSCNLALVARRADRLEALAAELRAQGVQVLAQACDVTVDADRASLARAVEERFGGLQLLSNNAGILLKGLAGQEPLSTFRRNMETNYFAPIDLTQRCPVRIHGHIAGLRQHLCALGLELRGQGFQAVAPARG